MDADKLYMRKILGSTSEDEQRTRAESDPVAGVYVPEEHISDLLGVLTTEACNVLLRKFILPSLAFIVLLASIGWILASKENCLTQLWFNTSGAFIATMIVTTLYCIENFTDRSNREVMQLR